MALYRHRSILPLFSCPLPVMAIIVLGSEIEVVTDLLQTGAFAHINGVMIEWHERLAKSYKRKRLSRNIQVKYITPNTRKSLFTLNVPLSSSSSKTNLSFYHIEFSGWLRSTSRVFTIIELL